MPFTFSHPALVLPLNHFFKRRVSLTGLVAGSIVPDFEYFVRDFHRSFYSHTWTGLFYIDLPAGLLLCFLYHNLIRAPFYSSAPLFLKQRLTAFQMLNWNRWFTEKWRTILVCIVIGALSHLLWDKLTHHTVPLVRSASGIKHFENATDREMTYYLFWDINSLIGGFFLLYSIWVLPVDKSTTRSKEAKMYWLLFATGALLLSLMQMFSVKPPVLDNVVIALINAVLWSFLLVSMVFTIRNRLHQKGTSAATKKGNMPVALEK